MSILVAEAKEQINGCITAAANAAMADGSLEKAELTEFSVSAPADRSHGDYAANAAMVWARLFRSAPRAVAEKLCAHMSFEGTYVDRCEIAGPGFINFFLSDMFYADILTDVDKKGADYGKSDYGKGKKILVEFVSANPTGPMHIGNARGGALGDCLASVL